jgi:uncharacterized lipoprotein YmbA
VNRSVLFVALLPLAACETAPPTHEQIVLRQMEEIVEAQQPQCVAVREVRRAQRFDYRVECDDGQVFDVRVSADGRVRVQPVAP